MASLSDKDILGLARGTPSPVADNSALRKLQSSVALANINNAAQGRRSTATNIAGLNKAFLNRGILPSDSNRDALLTEQGSNEKLKLLADIGLVNANQGFGPDPVEGTTGVNLNDPRQRQRSIVPPSVRAATLGPKTTTVDKEEFQRPTRPGEESVGPVIPVTRTITRQESTNKDPGRNALPLRLPTPTPPALANRQLPSSTLPPKPTQSASTPVSPSELGVFIQGKPQETEDHIYRTAHGYTGWWTRNPETGRWNPDDQQTSQ